jgi:hypothetical protein
MPRTSIQIGGMRCPLRAGRRLADGMAELFGETIRTHAKRVHDHPIPLRARLIEIGTEGDRGPP